MNNTVLATIVVNYSGNATEKDVDVVFESDPLKNVQLDGSLKTTFTEEDDYYFLLQIHGDAHVKSIKTSAGGVVFLGNVTQERASMLDFPSSNKSDFTLPSVAYTPNKQDPKKIVWFGNEGKGLIINKSSREASINGGVTPCKANVVIDTDFLSYKLIPPRPLNIPNGFDSFEILIVVTVEG